MASAEPSRSSRSTPSRARSRPTKGGRGSTRWARPSSAFLLRLIASPKASTCRSSSTLFSTTTSPGTRPVTSNAKAASVDLASELGSFARRFCTPPTARSTARFSTSSCGRPRRSATRRASQCLSRRSAVTGALMNAVLLRKKAHSHRQLAFDFGADVAAMETRWRDAEEGEKRSRARFAQNAMKPEEVAPEWRRWRNLLGSPSEVQRFVTRAMARFNAPLEGANGVFKAHLAHLPNALVERLSARGLDGTIRIAFDEPPPAGGEVAARSHPL